MIILCGSQKGGCGKSTLAINIAVALALKGKDICLVDSDRQGTSSIWANERVELSKSPDINCVQKYGNVVSTLRDLDNRYEYIIADTAGRDSQELRTGMTVSDILLSPFKASQADLNTIPYLEDLIISAKDFNPKLKAYALLSMVSTNLLVKEEEQARILFEDSPTFTLLVTKISDRKVFRDSLPNGSGICEESNLRAKEEISSLLKELINV